EKSTQRRPAKKRALASDLMIVTTAVKSSFYRDSLTLLRLCRDLKDREGVDEVAALMGTPANKQLLATAGLLTAEADTAGPNDLVIAVRTKTSTDARDTLARVDQFFTESHRALESAVRTLPRTLDAALRQSPAANLALISVPGQWATSEARNA